MPNLQGQVFENLKRSYQSLDRNVTSLSEESPRLLIGLALGSGILIGYLGFKKIVKFGIWLKTNEQLFNSPQNVVANSASTN